MTVPGGVKPTRRTQPYRALGGRQPGAALTAMKRGRTAAGFNPMDPMRHGQLLAAAGRRLKRRKAPQAPRAPRP